jgi:hypothetical protein
VGLAVLSLMLSARFACASEYCTKEQYARDHALIKDAFSTGMLVEGPKSLRDSILVREVDWYKMNYPQQISFMQSLECSMAGLSGKHLLIMDVRSLTTGKLLASWFAGTLTSTEEPRDVGNPEKLGDGEDENRIGLTGEARAAFIKSAIQECNTRSANINCSCYANAMADKLSTKELKDMSGPDNQDAVTTALRPKLEAAAKRCSTN